MKTFAIGDIHGCLTELVNMMEYIKTSGKYNPDEDVIVFLGDYIDRGPNSAEVVKYIRSIEENNDRIIALMGNHEDMLLDYAFNYDDT